MSSLPAIIQAVPQGWLDLLRLKNTGQNPNQAATFVQGVIDLTPFYASQQFETLDGGTLTFNAANTSDFGNLTVPQTECWWIDSLVCRVEQVSAATTGLVQVCVRTWISGGTRALLFPSGEQSITAPADVGRMFVPTASSKTLILGPGDTVAIDMRNFTGAGTIGIRAYARITRLTI